MLLFFVQNEVKQASNINKREKEMNKPATVKADVQLAHNYSTQSLNSTELAKEKLRQMLAQVYELDFYRICTWSWEMIMLEYKRLIHNCTCFDLQNTGANWAWRKELKKRK